MQSSFNFQIRLAYYLGIAADALWSVGLLVPSVMGALTGEDAFANPDAPLRAAMTMAGILMMGWTILLAWALQSPIERRGVGLITACPVVVGMLCISLADVVIVGNTFQIWIVIKTTILLVACLRSYQLAEQAEKKKL